MCLPPATTTWQAKPEHSRLPHCAFCIWTDGGVGTGTEKAVRRKGGKGGKWAHSLYLFPHIPLPSYILYLNPRTVSPV